MCSWVDENPTFTSKELVSKAQNAFGFSSVHSINCALGSFNSTLKRTTLVPERCNCQVTIQKHKEHAVEFRTLEVDVTRKTSLFLTK